MDEEELMLLFLFILLCHRFNIMLTRLRKGRGHGFRLVCPHHFIAIFRPREKHVYSVVPG